MKKRGGKRSGGTGERGGEREGGASVRCEVITDQSSRVMIEMFHEVIRVSDPHLFASTLLGFTCVRACVLVREHR